MTVTLDITCVGDRSVSVAAWIHRLVPLSLLIPFFAASCSSNHQRNGRYLPQDAPACRLWLRITHRAHDVVATLNQSRRRWFNVAITSCDRWEGAGAVASEAATPTDAGQAAAAFEHTAAGQVVSPQMRVSLGEVTARLSPHRAVLHFPKMLSGDRKWGNSQRVGRGWVVIMSRHTRAVFMGPTFSFRMEYHYAYIDSTDWKSVLIVNYLFLLVVCEASEYLIIIKTHKDLVTHLKLSTTRRASCLVVDNLRVWSAPTPMIQLRCDYAINMSTLWPPNFLIVFFTRLKLCLADAIHNFKWGKIIPILRNGGQRFWFVLFDVTFYI